MYPPEGNVAFPTVPQQNDPFNNWEKYPSCLPDFDSLCENDGSLKARLTALSSSIFSTRLEVHVIDANSES
jgi:hypothetical protein